MLNLTQRNEFLECLQSIANFSHASLQAITARQSQLQQQQQGPPPPYHTTIQRSASVPIQQSPTNPPTSPSTNSIAPQSTSSLSLPSPRNNNNNNNNNNNSPGLQHDGVGGAPTTNSATTAAVTNNSRRNLQQQQQQFNTGGINSSPSTPLSMHNNMSPKDIQDSFDSSKHTRPSPQRVKTPQNNSLDNDVARQFMDGPGSGPGTNNNNPSSMNFVGNNMMNNFCAPSGMSGLERQNSLPTGTSGGFCRRNDNLPLNPNSNRVVANNKLNHATFDPISSLAQMSQQLSCGSGGAAGPAGSNAGGNVSGMLGGPNDMGMSPVMSHAQQMDALMHGMNSDVGVGVGGGPNMEHIGLNQFGGGGAGAGPAGNQMNALMGGPGPGPGARLMNPKMCLPFNAGGPGPNNFHPHGPGGPGPHMGHHGGPPPPHHGLRAPNMLPNNMARMSHLNFPGANPNNSNNNNNNNNGTSNNNFHNVQVKASTPNTIQYMPVVRPQTATANNNNNNNNNNMRITPSLEFLQRFTTNNVQQQQQQQQQTHLMDGTGNASGVGGAGGPANNGQNFFGPGPGGNFVGVDLPDDMLTHENNMSAMMVARGGGPGMARGGPRPQMVGGPGPGPGPGPGGRMQSMGGMNLGGMMGLPFGGGGGGPGPNDPSDPTDCFKGPPDVGGMNMDHGVMNPLMVAGGGPKNNMLSNQMGGGGPMGGPGPGSGPGNNGNDFRAGFGGGPTTNDLKYAQQYHSFQQQLYATTTRSQLQQQQGGVGGPGNANNSQNQAFFVNK